MEDVKRAAEAQMRRHAPDDAEGDAHKRAKVTERGAPRFAYAALKSLLAPGAASASGYLVTCAYNRERSATVDAMRVLAGSGSGDLAVAKLPCHGVLFLLRYDEERDPARVASRAVASVRAAPTSGSRFVEKIYPISGTFVPDDDNGLDAACARVVREAIARGLPASARFAVTYNRRVRMPTAGEGTSSRAVNGGDTSAMVEVPKSYARDVLRTRVASAIEKACKSSGVDIVVDLKRPNFVVFIEVLATSTSEHVVAIGGSIADDDLYAVKSRRISPVSISSLTLTVVTPKWMVLKEEKRLAAERAAAAAGVAENNATTTTTTTSADAHRD